MEDKKTIWENIKALFSKEIKADAEAQKEAIEPPKEEPKTEEKMTIEEMKAELEKAGHTVSKEETKTEVVDAAPAPQATDNAKLLAKMEAMEAKINAQEKALKDAKFAAAASTTTGKDADRKSDKKAKMSAANVAAFDTWAKHLNGNH